MLAGLLFALHDADDRPGQLTATLPFGGATVIEYQARLLAAAGAAQFVVVIGRLTPELIGALGRIGRRGVAVDAVRTAEEVVGKLHPLARVLMVADGLVTTQEVVDGVAAIDSEALLIDDAGHAPSAYERLGGGAAWAGLARLDARRLAEVARLPRDYDLQSTVLRLADQARAVHLMLPPGATSDGHGIERAAAPLAERGRAVLAATVADRRNWFNAVLIAPAARAAVPSLVARGMSTIATVAAAATLGASGVGIAAWGAGAAGLALSLAAIVMLGIGRTLAVLRDEEALARACPVAQAVVAGGAGAALGWMLWRNGDALAPVVTVLALLLAVLAERAAMPRLRQRWWGAPPAFLTVALLGTLAGAPLLGIVAALGYAGGTLAAAVERLRAVAARGA